jgi:hypothetical protein
LLSHPKKRWEKWSDIGDWQGNIEDEEKETNYEKQNKRRK